MRGIIVALVPLTATTLEPTTRRRAAQRLAAAAVTLAPLESNAVPPIPLPEGRPPPEVTAPSSKRQLRVVEALNAKGFEFYGAYWCRYCDEQRRLLGKSAAQRIGILLNSTELGSQGYDALLVGALALLPAALQFGASARDGISCHLA